MGIAEKARSYNRFVQDSYQNSVHAVQSVHQSMAELYVDMLLLGGLPADWGDKMKDTHGEFIDLIYRSVVDAFGEVGELVVKQVENMAQLGDEFVPDDEGR